MNVWKKDEEEGFRQRVADGMDIKAIAKIHRRTVQAVRCKGNRMGIIKRGPSHRPDAVADYQRWRAARLAEARAWHERNKGVF